ncbi:MAG: hypothetical protein V1729_00790 [Candidatus Woesearchaeota archaeon]
MKTTTITILIAASLILSLMISGCGESTTGIVLECTPPLIQSGDSCCLDADQNGVCDSKEKIDTVDDNMVDAPDKDIEDTPAPIDAGSEEVETVQTSTGELKSAEEVANLFVKNWNSQAYNLMYPLLTDDLKAKKTTKEFKTIMELDPFYNRLKDIEMNGVIITGDDTAEMDIIAHTNIQNIKIPAAQLEFERGSWKVNIFADVFELNTYDAACSGYRYNKQYTMADCAFDYAKKMEDIGYCNLSECHYLECVKALGKTAGKTAEAEQCFQCQPTGKTTMQCILDIAIKYDDTKICDVISPLSYSNKYCTCYGGFAKTKNNGALCNVIADQEFKDLCLKGFGGGYC